MKGERPTWAQIDLDAVRHNAAVARRLAAGRDVIAVVKADAYGHGAAPVAHALLEAGCARLAVLSIDESAELREAAVASPILVLGGVHDPREAERAVASRVTPVLHHEGSMGLLAAAAHRAGVVCRVQVEIDTGMRRMGVAPGRALDLLRQIEGSPSLELEGVFTHLARAEEPDLGPSLSQLEQFRGVLSEAAAIGIRPPMIHALNSAGLMVGEPLHEALPEANAVRPGLMLYGVRPAAAFAPEIPLRPVMTLRSRVVQVHTLSPGEGVGYGATYRATERERVATLPVGYADGIPWSHGPRAEGEVWLAGARRPIRGRVSMDYISVGIGDDAVEIGDEAIVLGGPRDAGIPAEEAAARSGSLSYEMLVRVGERVPRRGD